MKMHELIRYGLPPEVIALWQERESEVLLPLQEMAVKRHGLFEAGNLLVQAPTSSGKTFIGEMAVLHTALRRKKVVYLVPLKALAEEKFLDFKEKYGEYGLRVIISTRDHRDSDQDFEEGRFSIAVVVYEKLAQLLVRRPERIEEIELIIADELEILSDPERGAAVELLLTRILQSNRRLIGLSAVIGEAEKLAQWMRAQLVYSERRPVELRYGVLYDGVFKYRTYNDLGEGEEAFSELGGESAWEVLVHNLCELTHRGESCLVFVKAKHESRQAAEILSGRIDLPAAHGAIEALRGLEATRSRDVLMQTLEHGVVFHNADLSPRERRIAEQTFREGGARIMVSTSTLAAGMNLPAQNVFLSADRWRYDDRLGLPWKTPILRAEYENMSGRAGRYGAVKDFGRSVLIATTPFDQETLWRRYVEGERERITPQLSRGPLEDHVLRLVASRFCRTEDELVATLEATLTGVWIWREMYTVDEVACRVRSAVHRALDAGMLATSLDERLEATPLGRAVAAKGITIATARQLEHWIVESETRNWTDIDLLFAAAVSPDGRNVQVLLTTREYERANYPALLKALTRDEELVADTPVNRIRNCTLQPFFEEVRAIKTVLFLHEWLEHAAVCELEERYNTMAGQILAAADQTAWILDTTAAVAVALGAPAQFVDRIRMLAERTARGLHEGLLPLAHAHIPGLDRNLCIRLEREGLVTAAALRQCTPAELGQWMDASVSTPLLAWAQSQEELRSALAVSPPLLDATPRPVLIVDDCMPGEICIDGVRVVLQDKQYRLVRLLAANPNVCVPYETIYQELWGEIVVEDNQIHFQKRKLIKAISDAAPHRAGIIQTIAKRGFRLELESSRVLVKAACIVDAA